MVDAATALTHESPPEPGHITICLDCGHVMAFSEDMTLRELNDEEMLFVAGNKEILRLQEARGYAKKEMDKKK